MDSQPTDASGQTRDTRRTDESGRTRDTRRSDASGQTRDTRRSDASGQTGASTNGYAPTRRAVLATGGTVALGGFAGCSAIDDLLDRASEQAIGTTASAPAAFYPGRASDPESNGSAAVSDSQSGVADGLSLRGSVADTSPQTIRTGETTVRSVPPVFTHQGRGFDLEGWAISTSAKANDYNSVRSNKRRTEWWGGPDDQDDDEERDILVDILDIELELLRYVTTGLDAVDRRSQAEANAALDGFIAATTSELRPELDRCDSGVCQTVREHSDSRHAGVQSARDAVDGENWDAAARELETVEQLVLGDIERLDDELVERRPERPHVIDIVRYLRDEPTIGERFTVCLPDAKLPDDRGSVAEALTPEVVLAAFAASYEDDGPRPPFHDLYGSRGIEFTDDSCIQIDGPVSLHEDLSCGSVLSAKLDTYRTANRGIVGFSTAGAAVVSGASITAEGSSKCVFVAPDGTLREASTLSDGEVYCWGQGRSASNGLYCWGQNRTAEEASPRSNGSGGGESSDTFVCPVSVTPADCPCPLPGLFYMRRCIHDNQLIYAGGWMLDEGALFEDSATLLFDEGPTEFASVTPEDVEGDEYDERVFQQLSRDRSQQGSAALSGVFDAEDASIPAALRTERGRTGLEAVHVRVAGERRDGSDEPVDRRQWSTGVALDAPLVHLADAGGTSDDVKFKAGAELSKSVN